MLMQDEAGEVEGLKYLKASNRLASRMQSSMSVVCWLNKQQMFIQNGPPIVTGTVGCGNAWLDKHSEPVTINYFRASLNYSTIQLIDSKQ